MINILQEIIKILLKEMLKAINLYWLHNDASEKNNSLNGCSNKPEITVYLLPSKFSLLWITTSVKRKSNTTTFYKELLDRRCMEMFHFQIAALSTTKWFSNFSKKVFFRKFVRKLKYGKRSKSPVMVTQQYANVLNGGVFLEEVILLLLALKWNRHK